MSRLRLLRSHRVGPSTYWRLMRAHDGDADAALNALPELAAKSGDRRYRPCCRAAAEREWAAAHRLGAVPLWIGTNADSSRLGEIDDPPPLLWARGRHDLLSRPILALVGARNASSLGLRMAASLGRDLGTDGIVIVSGLARGVDTAAHKATLATGTIAVVAGGPDVAYPQENGDLMARIVSEGLLLSEMPPGTRPQGRHFPRRNRLVSGLSQGVIVVEAAPRSGSLITARDAADQGREVMAVPGHPFDARAAGCNMLIRDGATLIRSADDARAACFAGAGTAPPPRSRPKQPPMAPPLRPRTQQPDVAPPKPPEGRLTTRSAIEAEILDRLALAPIAEDVLRHDLPAAPAAVSEALLALELDGDITRAPGGLIARRI